MLHISGHFVNRLSCYKMNFPKLDVAARFRDMCSISLSLKFSIEPNRF